MYKIKYLHDNCKGYEKDFNLLTRVWKMVHGDTTQG